jgi:Amt family ammonium transporter
VAAIGLGLVAGAACAVFVDLKYRFGLDDSLDVVGVHLGAGLIGTLSLGFIALPVNGQGGGLFYGGGVQQLIAQTAAVVITLLLSGVGTAVIARVINKTVGFRVSHEAETAGVDLSEHAETAYAFGEMGAGFNPLGHAAPHKPAPAPATAGQELHAKEDSFA